MTSYALSCIIPGTSVFKFPLVKYLQNQKLLILEVLVILSGQLHPLIKSRIWKDIEAINL